MSASATALTTWPDMFVIREGPITTKASEGMCGGMVFAVMDYHAAAAGLLPPDDPQAVQDDLLQFIRRRLIETFTPEYLARVRAIRVPRLPKTPTKAPSPAWACRAAARSPFATRYRASHHCGSPAHKSPLLLSSLS